MSDEKEPRKKKHRPMPNIVSRTGGKNFLKSTIVPMIPDHETYVELFVGGGSVFFSHPQSKKEVINDLDKDIFNLYRDAKSVGDKIEGKDFSPSREKFWRLLKQKNFKTPQERLYRNIFVSMNSFGGSRKSYIGEKTANSYLNDPSKVSRKFPQKWQTDQFKERLKDTTILNQDFKGVIKKYDSPTTFFYLDPPYSRADKNQNYTHTGVTIHDVYNAVKSIKGKFLISYDDVPEARKIFKDFNVIRVPTSYASGKGGVTKKVCELLIYNYNITKPKKKCEK